VSQSSFVIANATKVRVAIFILSKGYEIASLITFARKDITTHSLSRNDELIPFTFHSILAYFIELLFKKMIILHIIMTGNLLI